MSVIHEPWGSMAAVFIVNEAAPAGTSRNSTHTHTHLNDVRRGGICIRRLRKQEEGRLSHGKEQEIETNVSLKTSKEENTNVFSRNQSYRLLNAIVSQLRNCHLELILRLI